MDWHRVDDVDPKYGSGWTGYSWNKKLFPDPERFLGKLHARGMKTTLNVHPADGIRAYEDCYPEVAEAMGVDAKKKSRSILTLRIRNLLMYISTKSIIRWKKRASISGGLTGSRDKVPRSRVLIRCGC